MKRSDEECPAGASRMGTHPCFRCGREADDQSKVNRPQREREEMEGDIGRESRRNTQKRSRRESGGDGGRPTGVPSVVVGDELELKTGASMVKL